MLGGWILVRLHCRPGLVVRGDFAGASALWSLLHYDLSFIVLALDDCGTNGLCLASEPEAVDEYAMHT